MKYNCDAAIFDMDGTLIDSMRYWRFTTLEYLLKHGHPVREEDLAVMHDTSSRKLLCEIAEREGFELPLRPQMISELETFMLRHYQYDVSLLPHVPELLMRMADAGIPMCVATGAPRRYAAVGLERLGILNRFEFITDSYEFGLDKSKPEYFYLVAKRLGTTPDRCVVFEDALYSMEAAKAAGCRVVAREEDTARKSREKIKSIADIYVRSYDELWS